MYEHMDEMRWIMQLIDTQVEALEYLDERISTGDGDYPLYLLGDLVDAQVSVGKSLKRIFRILPNKNIDKIADTLEEKLIDIFLYIAKGDTRSLSNSVHKSLIPLYKLWRKELAACINPIILN